MTSLLGGIVMSLLLSELAHDGWCSVARNSAGIAGPPVLPIKKYEVIKPITEKRVSERDRGAECGCHHAADEAEDR